MTVKIKRDYELLQKIHQKGLELLDVFVEVCRQLNLRYTLSGGTMLGAVRHKGFIPWDDDIDVAMLREDYDIFIQKANNLLPEGFFLQHYSTDKRSLNVFAKIRNNNTTWIIPNDKLTDENLGIGLDIWPVERVDSPKDHKKIYRKTYIYNYIRYADKSRKSKSIIKNCVNILAIIILKMVGRYRINQMQDRFNTKSKNGEYTYADQINRRKLITRKIFEEYEEIEFEGKNYSTIKNRHEYLVSMYGENYMELPPEEKRVCHFAEIIDCENSYKDYTKNSKK